MQFSQAACLQSAKVTSQRSAQDSRSDYVVGGRRLANAAHQNDREKHDDEEGGDVEAEVPAGCVDVVASMSDGYRGFIGWVTDFLYHLTRGMPPERKVGDVRGIVLVDEIDLLLHPLWQMQVIEQVSRAFPRMQFIFTSHSPLIAGSLEWMNILTLNGDPKTNRTTVERLKDGIHGLDADQILLTDFFGLSTTRAPGKVSELDELRRRARHGDQEAARNIILAMSRGTEGKS